MKFTTSLLGLASLGLNILSVQSAAVPATGLAPRTEEAINHVQRSNMLGKRHDYGKAEDETSLEKRHDYGKAEDETSLEKRHDYGKAED